jgi:hypothetical protein
VLGGVAAHSIVVSFAGLGAFYELGAVRWRLEIMD